MIDIHSGQAYVLYCFMLILNLHETENYVSSPRIILIIGRKNKTLIQY